MIKLEDWIDYMEGESDRKTRGKLGLLLEHSSDHRVIYDNLVRLRQIILHADPAEQIESQLNDDKNMRKFHKKIMASLQDSPASSDQPSDQNSTRTAYKP